MQAAVVQTLPAAPPRPWLQVIVMEYAANGQLAERIDTSGALEETLARRLYRQLIDGMAYSHAQARCLPGQGVPDRPVCPGNAYRLTGRARRMACAGALPGHQLTACLHAQGIYHRDLRMENLLLDGQFSSPHLKISDFAYSKNAVLDSQPKTNVGSPSYTPPELLLAQRGEGTAYDGAAIDVWSSGVILFYMLTGQLPFQARPAAASCRVLCCRRW